MTPTARIAAAIALLDALESAPRRPADAVANDFFRARRFIGSGDRRAIADRAWGVVRERARLDWHLDHVGAAPSGRLLMAAHMILAEGAGMTGVEAAFTGGQYAERPLSAEERRFVAKLDGRPLHHPRMDEATRLNVPEWALPGLRARFGEGLPAAAAGLEGSAPLDLRVNLLRTTRETAAAALAAEGIETAPTPFSPWGLRVAERRPVLATRAFEEGLVEIQDEGSQLIALLADARPGMKVADYCAGAAGKTLAMAATMGNRGRIAALDVSVPRLAGATKRLKRAGVDNAETHLLEAGDRWVKRRAASFDRVLVDAPCTGTGTWRRNPDARLRTTERDLEELITKQRAILDRAASLVRPGGKLIYATCSVLPGEDDEQVRRFLDDHGDFAAVDLAQAWSEAGMSGPAPGEGTFMALAPHSHGTDGFSAAIPQRRPQPQERGRHGRDGRMIQIRRARPDDAAAVGAIHRIAWQDTYPGILPDAYLAGLDQRRIGAGYLRSMLARGGGEALFVACAPDGAAVGFASAGRARRTGIAEGEIETLYILPDWQDQGIGRRLMRAAAAHLSVIGCRSAMLWVLSANGAGWFYRRLGGRLVGRERISVGGQAVEQTAIRWDPISLLLDATAASRDGSFPGESKGEG